MSLCRSLLLVAAGMLGAGCTAIGDRECRTSDWYALGEGDALIYGLQPRIDQYVHACGRYGIQPSEKDYLAGWFHGDRERAIRMLGGGECCP